MLAIRGTKRVRADPRLGQEALESVHRQRTVGDFHSGVMDVENGVMMSVDANE